MKAVPHNDNADTVEAGKIHNKVVNFDDTLAAADPKVPTMEDFLHQLSMTIEMDDKVIYESTAEDLDGLSDWVKLGSFYRWTKKTLKVKLSVPIELGNEYAYRAGEVDWVFLAEEVPYTPGPNNPRTSDETPIGLYVGLAGGALVVMACVLFVYKRKKTEE